MKNLIVLATPEEIDDYAYGLWQTDEFRKSHKTQGGYINKMVEAFKSVPRAFHEMDDPGIEWSHFTAWMNNISLRNYEGRPTVSDLYYLHEIWHATTMPYAPSRMHSTWTLDMTDNERDATMASQVYVYFELPTIRAKSFGFEIWADRFLENRVLLQEGRTNHELFEQNPTLFHRLFTRERLRAMHVPIEGDDIEHDLNLYHKSNLEWFDVWRDRRREIDTKMQEFQSIAAVNRQAAANFLKRWLLASQGDGLCAYEAEARDFAARLDVLKQEEKQSSLEGHKKQ